MRFKAVQLESGKKLNIVVQNGRTWKLSPVMTSAERYSEDGKTLESLVFDEIEFKQGEISRIGKDILNIKKITKIVSQSDGGYILSSHIINKSSNFIMPLLGTSRNNFRWATEFCNCFIGKEELGDWGDNIYLLYRHNASRSFSEFETKMTQHPWFNRLEDPDKHHVLYVFDIPEKNRELVKTILEGKYSKIPDDYKLHLLKFHNSTKGSVLGQILYKNPKRAKYLAELYGHDNVGDFEELLELFNPEEELYMEHYKILEKDEQPESAEPESF